LTKIVFVIGGARSGKSSFALKEASRIKGKKAYIATAEAIDDEMKERIKRHRKERGKKWDTYEEPLEITKIIKAIRDRYNVIVLDCLTMWVSNLMMEDGRWKMENGKWKMEKQVEEFIHCLNGLNSLKSLNLYIISNEVGMGIVPDNKLSRQFRDLAGTLNQKVAKIANEVYLITAGIPVKIK
jgi:adenosylcobinamide kinase/adenosylcobinamide-phosphate guanylyltransferase